MDTKIQNIMRKPVLIGNDASFLDALRKMICEKTNSLLIINKKGALVGKIQALDLLRQIKPGYMDADNGAIAAHFANEEIFREACEKTKDQPLETFMDKDPHTIGPQASLLEAAVTA
ncbi:MAG: CBS domain-containing protein, partial [Desulfobulbaceae bacterium]|nr:CBS domain-containing protein [Desulfobulbaceae bacterium]